MSEYRVWNPGEPPVIKMLPPPEWLDAVITEAISHYVKDGSFHIRGDTLDIVICSDWDVLAEKQDLLSRVLDDAIRDGDPARLTKLRAVLSRAIEGIDDALKRGG